LSPLAALVTPNPGGRGGGVELHVSLLADLLTDKGWDVEEVGGSAQLSPWGRRLGLEPRAMSRAAVAPLSGLKTDLVITNGFLGAGVRRTPRIHVYHGTMVGHVWAGERDLPLHARCSRAASFGLAERRAAGHGAVIVAVSDQVAVEAKRYYRRTVDAVIPLAVDLERFRPRSRAAARKRFGLDRDRPLALYVGRNEHRKGADMLARICELAGCGLIVAGDGAPEGGTHLGQLAHDELPWAYAAADAVLFPTRYEGFGFVSLEALACERPLVSTPTGWAATLAREVAGYRPFITAAEVDPLGAALRRALQSPGDVPVSEAARYVRENLSLERFRQRWSDLIDEVVAS
jgi:glycosyltransferase involved in cell wall biosynthesis